jgi:hypothetical protein
MFIIMNLLEYCIALLKQQPFYNSQNFVFKTCASHSLASALLDDAEEASLTHVIQIANTEIDEQPESTTHVAHLSSIRDEFQVHLDRICTLQRPSTLMRINRLIAGKELRDIKTQIDFTNEITVSLIRMGCEKLEEARKVQQMRSRSLTSSV